MKFTQVSLKTATACVNRFQGYSLYSLLLKNLSVKWEAADSNFLRLFSLNWTHETPWKQISKHFLTGSYTCFLAAHFNIMKFMLCKEDFGKMHRISFFLFRFVHTCAHKSMTYMISMLSFYFKDWRSLLWPTAPLRFSLWKNVMFPFASSPSVLFIFSISMSVALWNQEGQGSGFS